MSRLLPCSGEEAVKKLKRAGWMIARQKGSHVMMTKPDYPWTLAIPQHDELGPGLLRKIIHQAGMSVDDFNEL